MKKMYIGTMGHVDKDLFKEILREAHRCSYYGVDSAWIYKNEKLTGEVLEELRNEGIDMKIQTKIWTDHFGDVRGIFTQMLQDLRVDKVHSLLLHRPSLDFNQTIEAWRELIALQDEGKVKHIGVSNFDKDMIQILIEKTGVKPEFNQVEMSLTNFREDRLFYNNKMGIETQGWSALGKDPRSVASTPLVEILAHKYKVTPGCIMLSYLTTQGIVPIVGTHQVARVEENIKTITLTEDEINNLKHLNIYENKFEETFPH